MLTGPLIVHADQPEGVNGTKDGLLVVGSPHTCVISKDTTFVQVYVRFPGELYCSNAV